MRTALLVCLLAAACGSHAAPASHPTAAPAAAANPAPAPVAAPPAIEAIAITAEPAHPDAASLAPIYTTLSERLLTPLSVECGGKAIKSYPKNGDVEVVELDCEDEEGGALDALAFHTPAGWIAGQLFEIYKHAGREEQHEGKVALTEIDRLADGSLLVLWHTQVNFSFADLDQVDDRSDAEWTEGLGYHELHVCLVSADGTRGGCHTFKLGDMDSKSGEAATWSVDDDHVVTITQPDGAAARYRFHLAP